MDAPKRAIGVTWDSESFSTSTSACPAGSE